MAKSGMYLNGKELLECELDKLSEIKKLEARLETHIRMDSDLYREIAKTLAKSPSDSIIKD